VRVAPPFLGNLKKKIMNLRAWLFVVFLGCFGCLPTLAKAGNERNRVIEPASRIALVIGNANYTNAMPLKNAANDATDMCAALRKLGFDVICKIDVGTKREFKDAVFEFTGKINSRTVALFYFAGHGVQVDGINYLIPVKAALRTKSDIEDEGVQVNYLMSELDARQAELNIFFMDACRNNPFANPIRGYVPMMGMASQLYAPRNSIIAMSTGAGQLSLDGDGRNGTFTKNLLENISVPHQSIEESLKATSSGTRRDANRFKRQQEPQITESFADRFCMAGCADGAPHIDDGLLKSKTEELNRLQVVIAETRAKQAELDSQQTLLMKKRAELDSLKQGLTDIQSRHEELELRRAEVSQRERELDKLSAGIKASKDRYNELEGVRLSLQKKQEEVDQMRRSLALQEASIEAANKEIATRAVKPPEKKAPPIALVPTF
jgi:uncharacterized caspase-like protein